MRALDSRGIAENTIVCFSSDHGDHLSAHGFGKPGDSWLPPYLRGSKATPHDESVHVPFILRYPRSAPANRRTDTMLNSVDVMPTLLGLCGVEIPDAVQGRDLSHAALGTPGDAPDSVYLQILGTGWPDRATWLGLWRGVRTHRYTYARWHDRDGMRVLYDLRNDPLEMKNLADDPAHAQVAREMEERLQRWITETDDPFDSGPRLPVTGMLDLEQRLVRQRDYGLLPPGYGAAIEKYRPADLA
jgi:arylsulfatase A-like enzyme